MASCERSANRASAALALAIVLVHPSHALAQAKTSSCCPSVEDRARGVLERLRAAREAQGGTPVPRGPTRIPEPDAAQGKRAFEGLRRRTAAPGIEERARKAEAAARGALAAERASVAKRIGQALGLAPPDIAAVAAAGNPPAAKAWVPVLFVSSSMPIATLRSYAVQLEQARGVLAFRGMPGGLTRVEPMARLSAEVLRIDPGCEGPACAMRNVELIVDPLLFRQHGVSRVPALTMIPGDPVRPYCEREDESPPGSHLVLGDAALSGLFEEYGRLGGGMEVQSAAALLESR